MYYQVERSQTNMGKIELSLRTPSKINIFLKIIGRLPNGYHELENIFLPLEDIYDVIKITFNSNKKIEITSNNSSIPLTKENLCYKAAELFSREAKVKPEWEIHIEKEIPIAAGMGGGSSDAAAVLHLLQNYYSNILSQNQLNKLALKLGADVPFFLNPIPSLGKGVGEKLEEIEIKSGLYIIIAAPNFPVSAAWAYKNYIPDNKKTNLNNILDFLKTGKWNNLGKTIHNDLAPALYKKFPILKIIKNDLTKSGALHVEITGSGPTLFGIADSKEKAENIVTEINRKYSNTIYCKYSKILTNNLE